MLNPSLKPNSVEKSVFHTLVGTVVTWLLLGTYIFYVIWLLNLTGERIGSAAAGFIIVLFLLVFSVILFVYAGIRLFLMYKKADINDSDLRIYLIPDFYLFLATALVLGALLGGYFTPIFFLVFSALLIYKERNKAKLKNRIWKWYNSFGFYCVIVSIISRLLAFFV